MPNDPAMRPGGRIGLRHPGADYAAPGAYFVTICTAGRRPSLARFVDGDPVLTPLGNVVRASWNQIPDIRPAVALDALVLMPDHLHGILLLGSSPIEQPRSEDAAAPTLGTVVAGFKRAVSIEARRRGLAGPEPLWQRGYHDRVLRNARELDAIREYIATNPARWLAANASQF